MVVGVGYGSRPREFIMRCGCNTKDLGAVRSYLEEHFPECVFDDFHAPVRLQQADFPAPHAEHHVVKITNGETLPHYAIFLKEFFGSPAKALRDRLQQWNVEKVVRENLVAVISRDGAAPL